MPLAQTNLQLLAQLRNEGYSDHDLAMVNAAYWLAAEAFSGKVRGSGKPFLCHLVGTASATALERPPSHAIAAALCHGILESGDFGHLKSSAVAELLRQRLGSTTVTLLQRYAVMQEARATAIPDLLARKPVEAAEPDRWSALIWAANEADDETDAGSRFRRNRRDRDRRRDFSLALTRHFGWKTLEGALERAYASYEESAWADSLATSYTSSVTFAHRASTPGINSLKQIYRWLRVVTTRGLKGRC